MAKIDTKTRRNTPKVAGNVVEMEPPNTPDSSSEVPETPETSAEQPATVAEPLKVSAQPFPTPPKPKFKGGYCSEEEGMAYWRGLPEELLNRTNIYVNREGPHLNHLQEYSAQEVAAMRAKQRRYPAKYIDCPARPFGSDTRQEFLNRYGSGTFKVFVNDAGVRGTKDPNLQSRNLCKFWVKYWDSDFPPVLDPNRPDKGLGILDLLHPENQGYVADLRRQGILPPIQKAGDDNDVATSQVVEKLADKVDSLSSQVAEGKQEQLFNRIKEELGKTNGNGDGKIMELIIASLLTGNGKSGDMTAIITLMQTQAQAQSAAAQLQMQALQAELAAEREARRKYEMDLLQRANAPAPDPFSQFEKVMGMIDKARELVQGGSTVANVARGKTTVLDVIKEVADTPFGSQLGQAVNILFSNLTRSSDTNGHTAPQVLNPAPATAPVTHETDAQRLQRISQSVTNVMINEYFDKEEPGNDFAVWMYNGFPEDFLYLRKLGADTIINLMRQFPPLWSHITADPKMGNREQDFRKFIAEICAFKTPEEEKTTAAPTPSGDGFEEQEEVNA